MISGWYCIRIQDTSDLFPSVWPFKKSDHFLIALLSSSFFLSLIYSVHKNFIQELSNSDVHHSMVVIHITPAEYIVKRLLYLFLIKYVVNSCLSSPIIKTLVNFSSFFSHWPEPRLTRRWGSTHSQAKSAKPLWAYFEAQVVIMYASCTDAFFRAGGLTDFKTVIGGLAACVALLDTFILPSPVFACCWRLSPNFYQHCSELFCNIKTRIKILKLIPYSSLLLLPLCSVWSYFNLLSTLPFFSYWTCLICLIYKSWWYPQDTNS